MSEGARFLVDANALIDASHRRGAAQAFIAAAARPWVRVTTSLVCIAAFLVGVPDADRDEALRFLETIPAMVVTFEIASLAAIYRRTLLRQGVSILLPDALIAATAFVERATLGTGIVKHVPIGDVRVLSPADALTLG